MVDKLIGIILLTYFDVLEKASLGSVACDLYSVSKKGD